MAGLSQSSSLSQKSPEVVHVGANVARYLHEAAAENPTKIALVATSIFAADNNDKKGSYTEQSYQQLLDESNCYARALANRGLKSGTRVLMMIPPGTEFVAIWFALLKLGAVVVLIDPGMGRKNLLRCIADVKPQVLIGIPLVHLFRYLFPAPFKDLKLVVNAGAKWMVPWLPSLWQLRDEASNSQPASGACKEQFLVDVEAEDSAAIVFTTGSTGVPKGVLYTHGTFDSQITAIKSYFKIEKEHVGFPAFLPFALYCVAMGTTAVMPKLNPIKPAEADASHMVELLEKYAVNYSFGSPAFWGRVAEYCVENEITLPKMAKVMMFGAPVSNGVLANLEAVLPNGDTFTPYGATEALPLTSISGKEVLGETADKTADGAGVCVGRPLPDVEMRIIELCDEPIAEWNKVKELPQGTIGEIVVKAPYATRMYFNRRLQTAMAKIKEGADVWHRMGDVGYFDAEGRFWFCGRKNHRVVTEIETLFSVPIESFFNQHPAVARTALVGVGEAGRQKPVLVVELEISHSKGSSGRSVEVEQEILEMAASRKETQLINTVLFHQSFPVDFRHNAKIIREELSVWAEKVLGA